MRLLEHNCDQVQCGFYTELDIIIARKVRPDTSKFGLGVVLAFNVLAAGANV